ncbi:MAG TPA: Shedu anti-phage system protein SduA domain-containing protein [Verrucomicrobiae bacterium]|nr:Shedu anti-phage system protein SduA domain-containing protein [Verrucomicrobiae bacterium]
MTQSDFASVCLAAFNAYLEEASELIKSEAFQSDIADPIFVYPTHVIIGMVSGFLFLELVGSSDHFVPLSKKFTKPESIYSFLGQVEEGEAMMEVGHHNTIGNLFFQTSSSNEALVKRFPKTILERYKSKIKASFDARRVFEFNNELDYFCLEDVMLLNNYDNQSRLRNPTLVFIVSNKTSKRELVEYLNANFRIRDGESLRVIKTFDSTSQHSIDICAQFYNLYLQSNIHETLISDFLEHHKEIILLALDGSDLIYQPELEWQVDAGQEETSIIPDFMIKRADGFFDICDLKLPLLSNSSLTTGHTRDRSFIAPIHKGLSQIAGYRDYFRQEKNRDYAMSKYKIKVDSPALTLVVGNYENYNNEFVKQAGRAYDEMRIIDYDTLITAYRIKATTDQ